MENEHLKFGYPFGVLFVSLEGLDIVSSQRISAGFGECDNRINMEGLGGEGMYDPLDMGPEMKKL